jgi:hypothetical protein
VLPLDDNLWVPLTTGFVIRLLLIPFTFWQDKSQNNSLQLI